MDVAAVNNNYATTAAQTNQSAAASTNTAVSADETEDLLNSAAAVYEKSGSKTYEIDPKAIKAAIDEANSAEARLQTLVTKLFGKQGNEALKAGGMQWSKDFWESLEVDEATRAEAEEAISEDGYFGVKQTSERILNFAKALSGGDPSKIATLRDAVEEGFAEAEKLWGDKLPQISYDTLDAVRKGFDEWEASFKTE
ncbi:MAG: hypothetical protein LBS21_02650 [Clostridiales bacterium]|jgi:hypothetical protein|nr:hypothetical protein [Clostridiales bacterium]